MLLFVFCSLSTAPEEVVEEKSKVTIDGVCSASHKSLIKGGYVNNTWAVIYLYNGSTYDYHMFAYGASTGDTANVIYTDTVHMDFVSGPWTDKNLGIERLTPGTTYNYMFRSYLPNLPDHQTLWGTFTTTFKKHHHYPNSGHIHGRRRTK